MSKVILILTGLFLGSFALASDRVLDLHSSVRAFAALQSAGLAQLNPEGTAGSARLEQLSCSFDKIAYVQNHSSNAVYLCEGRAANKQVVLRGAAAEKILTALSQIVDAQEFPGALNYEVKGLACSLDQKSEALKIDAINCSVEM